MKVLCKTPACYQLADKGHYWCRLCWRRISKLRRERIGRAFEHCQKNRDDAGARRILQAGIRDARRELEGRARIVSP